MTKASVIVHQSVWLQQQQLILLFVALFLATAAAVCNGVVVSDFQQHDGSDHSPSSTVFIGCASSGKNATLLLMNLKGETKNLSSFQSPFGNFASVSLVFPPLPPQQQPNSALVYAMGQTATVLYTLDIFTGALINATNLDAQTIFTVNYDPTMQKFFATSVAEGNAGYFLLGINSTANGGTNNCTEHCFNLVSTLATSDSVMGSRLSAYSVSSHQFYTYMNDWNGNFYLYVIDTVHQTVIASSLVRFENPLGNIVGGLYYQPQLAALFTCVFYPSNQTLAVYKIDPMSASLTTFATFQLNSSVAMLGTLVVTSTSANLLFLDSWQNANPYFASFSLNTKTLFVSDRLPLPVDWFDVFSN